MSQLTPLNVDACWSALAETSLGRIGFDLGRGPRIHPVNFALDGRSVLVTTSEDSELALFEELFAAGALVAFEADEVDRESRTGWSVLVCGRLGEVPEREHLRDPRPWADGHHGHLLRIVPVEVTGRRLGPVGSTPEAAQPRA